MKKIMMMLTLCLACLSADTALAQSNNKFKDWATKKGMNKIFQEFIKAVDPNALSQTGFRQVFERDGGAILNHARATNQTINGQIPFNHQRDQRTVSRRSKAQQNAYNEYSAQLQKLSQKYVHYLQLYQSDPVRYADLGAEIQNLAIEMAKLSSFMMSLSY